MKSCSLCRGFFLLLLAQNFVCSSSSYSALIALGESPLPHSDMWDGSSALPQGVDTTQWPGGWQIPPSPAWTCNPKQPTETRAYIFCRNKRERGALFLLGREVKPRANGGHFMAGGGNTLPQESCPHGGNRSQERAQSLGLGPQAFLGPGPPWASQAWEPIKSLYFVSFFFRI